MNQNLAASCLSIFYELVFSCYLVFMLSRLVPVFVCSVYQAVSHVQVEDFLFLSVGCFVYFPMLVCWLFCLRSLFLCSRWGFGWLTAARWEDAGAHNSLIADHDEDIGNCDDDGNHDHDDYYSAIDDNLNIVLVLVLKISFSEPISFRLVLSRQKTRS